MEKKVLELCDFCSNYGSNFIPSISFLEKKLKACGYETYFIFSAKNPSPQFFEWEKDFEIGRNVEIFDFSDYGIVKKTVDFIIENKIGIVHAHFIASFYLSEIKRKCPKNVMFFEQIHSVPYNGKKSFKAIAKHFRNIFLLSHKITKICISKSMEPMTKFIYPFCKTCVCNNAIDLSRLKRKNTSEYDEFNVLLFGYNYYVKGVDLAIEAVSEIYKTIPVHLDIVFSDNFEENKKIIINKYGKVPDFVSLLRPVSNVSDLYERHKVFLNASRSEGMSYAIIEAYYSGCLCVVSDVPATVETGLPNVIYFKSCSADSLARSLKEAYEEKDSYYNSCGFVEENLTLDSWAKRMLSIFNISVS